MGEEMGIPFLGEVPIDTRVRSGGDEGQPIVNAAPDAPAAKAFLDLSGRVAAQVSIATTGAGAKGYSLRTDRQGVGGFSLKPGDKDLRFIVRARDRQGRVGRAAIRHWWVAGAVGLLMALVLPILLVIMAFTVILIPLVLILAFQNGRVRASFSSPMRHTPWTMIISVSSGCLSLLSSWQAVPTR